MPKSKKPKSAGAQQVKKKNFPCAAAQFAPGQSGNPAGRTKGSKNRSTIARKVLEMQGILPDQAFAQLKAMYPQIEKTMTIEEIMTITLTARAINKGDHNAYKAVMDSGYGNTNQPITGADGGPIKLDIESKEDLIKEAAARSLPTKIFE